MFLTYVYNSVRREHRFSYNSIADWGQFCRQTMSVYMEGCSENIGGPNKIGENDKIKFCRRKYHRGHPVKGQWVFGGVQREYGKMLLVPVPDRTADTLKSVIDS